VSSILAITPVAHPGGAEIALLRLLDGLRTRGWQTALTTSGPGALRARARVSGHETTCLALALNKPFPFPAGRGICPC
jgi:hypothetical protein